MIRIVDYGLGNVAALLNAYKRLNIKATAARRAEELHDATRLILPGVGAYDHAMELLNGSGMREALDMAVLERRIPVLGICVGMQIIARSSDEGSARGLGWIDGKVKAFRELRQEKLRVPHMGWNDVWPSQPTRLFAHLETEARFYFLHSYYFECERAEDVAAVSEYGINFHCAVNAGNVFGVQFHPEKSHHFGTQLLKNFAEL